MKRIFIGIPVIINDDNNNVLKKVYTALNDEKIKWTRRENFHITVKFIGETGDEKIYRVRQLLARNYADIASFSFLLQGIGVFKNIHQPRVLWLGAQNIEPLKNIFNASEDALEKSGINKVEKNFHPHLTIGRIKYIGHKETLIALLNQYKDHVFGKQLVKEIILFESVLKKHGPAYQVIERFSLGQG